MVPRRRFAALRRFPVRHERCQCVAVKWCCWTTQFNTTGWTCAFGHWTRKGSMMLNSSANNEATDNGVGDTHSTCSPIECEAAASSTALQEREAIINAIERLEKMGTGAAAAVYVDDENRLPSYARHVGAVSGGQAVDDGELDYAIGWLPAEAFLNDDSPWPGSYNPYITLAHLRTIAEAGK